jgi:hypothetical protein
MILKKLFVFLRDFGGACMNVWMNTSNYDRITSLLITVEPPLMDTSARRTPLTFQSPVVGHFLSIHLCIQDTSRRHLSVHRVCFFQLHSFLSNLTFRVLLGYFLEEYEGKAYFSSSMARDKIVGCILFRYQAKDTGTSAASQREA